MKKIFITATDVANYLEVSYSTGLKVLKQTNYIRVGRLYKTTELELFKWIGTHTIH